MLLTISTTHKPATDLGFILMKNPDRVHSFELNFGHAHVFFPEASEERCTACLLVDVDSVTLVRGKSWDSATGVEHYVNDRPYVASSFLSVAMTKAFGTALSGRSRERQELADSAIELEATIAALPCRGGEAFLRKLFEPLGYEVVVEPHTLDSQFPEWGTSRYFTLSLSGKLRVHDLLSHLYVLIPVLDDEKHYFVDEAEVEKLLRHGEGWLASHPYKEVISYRYLAHKKDLSRLALSQLLEDEVDPDEADEAKATSEEAVEKPLSLNDQRIAAVVAALKDHHVHRVVDLGCGEGRLMRELLTHKEFELVTGVDVSPRVLEKAALRLRLERMSERQRERVQLMQSSLVYRDDRLKDHDAATCIEVIEHLDAFRIPALERAVFEYTKPRVAIFTTPNVEYNKKFETMAPGQLRHGDHRFEWSRAEFQAWALRVAQHYGYSVEFRPVGPVDEELGPPTQMGVFIREDKPS